MENYIVLERIGEGSFGKVYRGRRKFTGHVVALKFVSKRGKSEKDLKNLRQEISILRGISHSNIIAMLDSFETENEFCMITEYAQGELFQILEDDRQLPEDEIKKIAIQLVQALHCLHSNRIIHRDMKPQNILIGTKQQIKLCDFGFARSISANTSVLTSIKGTPLYMAPELVKELPYNHNVDLWSLGVILYELAVGRPPFYTDKIVSLIQLIVKENVKYPPTMSGQFQSFLAGLLNKDPSKRLSWPDILHHPFLHETEVESQARISLEKQVKCLPRFFNDTLDPASASAAVEEVVKPSMKRLQSSIEWTQVDPETGKHIVADDGNNSTSKNSGDNNTMNTIQTKLEEVRVHEDVPIQSYMTTNVAITTTATAIAATSTTAASNSNIADPVPTIPSEVHTLSLIWSQYDQLLNDNWEQLLQIPDFHANIKSILNLTLKYPIEFTRDIVRSTLYLLSKLYTSLLKSASTTKASPSVLAYQHYHPLLQGIKEHILYTIQCMLTKFQQPQLYQIADIVLQMLRCLMVLLSIQSQDSTMDYKMDFQTIALILQVPISNTFIQMQIRALKWLGGILNRHTTLVNVYQEVLNSKLIDSLCSNLALSDTQNYCESSVLSDFRKYTIFALSTIAHPVSVQQVGTIYHFPLQAFYNAQLLSYTSLNDTNRTSNTITGTIATATTTTSTIAGTAEYVKEMDILQQIYKLRTKTHSDIASHLLKHSNAVCTLLHCIQQCIHRHTHQDSGDLNTVIFYHKIEDDHSLLACIIKIIIHCSRSSSPFAKYICQDFQHASTTTTIGNVGDSSTTKSSLNSKLHRLLCIDTNNSEMAPVSVSFWERYFMLELVSILQRRTLIPKVTMPQWVQLYFSYCNHIFVDNTTLDPSNSSNNDTSSGDTIVDKELQLLTSQILCTLLSDVLDLEAYELYKVQVLQFVLLNDTKFSAQGGSLFQCLTVLQQQQPCSLLDMKYYRFTLCFNIRTQGILDSMIILLYRVLYQVLLLRNNQVLQQRQQLLSNMGTITTKYIWVPVCVLLNCGGNDYVSPWGVFNILKFIRLVLENECAIVSIEMNNSLLPQCIQLLRTNHIQFLLLWPDIMGGGSNAVKALCHAVVKILGFPFMQLHNNSTENTVANGGLAPNDDLLINTQEIIYDTGCIHHILTILQDAPHLEISAYDLPISFLSRLISSSVHFGVQFFESNGLLMIRGCKLLSTPTASQPLVLDTLSIITQLARSAEVNYKEIRDANILSELFQSALLPQNNAVIRAKFCNCIGNLCRFSNYFYKDFQVPQSHFGVKLPIVLPPPPSTVRVTPTSGKPAPVQKLMIAPGTSATGRTGKSGAMDNIIDVLIYCAQESDLMVKKFACFAIGNAAFHSNVLYGQLRHAIPYLLEIVTVDDEKTKSNACGALGNFVRNSEELCCDLVYYNAPSILFQEILKSIRSNMEHYNSGSSSSGIGGSNGRASHGGISGGHLVGVTFRRIALFSLGNFCVYEVCREFLLEKEPTLLVELNNLVLRLQDDITITNIQRILNKF